MSPRGSWPRGGVRTRLPVVFRKSGAEFTPKDITGLALWLDASDSSTLFQDAAATTPATATNDPVGAWLDKSGNARHATQSTAVSRPTISVPSGGTEMVNGRRALFALSSNAGGVSLGNIGSAFPNSSGTAFFAYKVNDGGSGIDNSYGIAMSRLNNSSTQSSGSNEGFWRTSRLTGTNPAPLPTTGYGAAIYTINSAASGYTLRYNSAPFYTTATQDWNAGNNYYLWSDPANNMTRLGGWIGEAIFYNRSLSASEIRRVEQYLSSRWGIALAPQVSNADAQDWINRVYANGGSVTSSTAAAVNTLCNDIDAAGIRDRFYRMGIFCGTGLNAALVPLYRGPSLGGTQYGNTTDTNVGPFVSGDYNEASGLKGNGSSKYLATGLPMTFASTEQLHLYASFLPDQASFSVLLGARTNLAGSLAMEANYNAASANRPRTSWFGGGAQPANNCDPLTGRTQYLVNYDGSQPLLVLGRNVSLNNSNNAGSYSATYSTPFFVFAGEQTGTGMAGHTTHTIDSYSIGVAFTSSTQRTAFHNAVATFRAALGRT